MAFRFPGRRADIPVPKDKVDMGILLSYNLA